MKKRLISLFILLFIPSLITGCDTKIEESENNDNNSSITETSVEDSSSTREKDSFPEKSSSSYDISSSVETEPYGYTIEDGKMVVDVKLIHYGKIDGKCTQIDKIINGQTYDVHELDLLKINASFDAKNIKTDNDNAEIWKQIYTNTINYFAFNNVGDVKITIHHENQDYDFFFNIQGVLPWQAKFTATQFERLYVSDIDNFIGYLRCGQVFDVIPGNEYILTYKGDSGSILESIPEYYVLDGRTKIISFDKSKNSTVETFIVLDGKAYKTSNNEKYPLVYTFYMPYVDSVVDFAIDEDGKSIPISFLADNTILYGYVNDGMVYGYYTYDVNQKDPIIIKNLYM